MDWRLSCSGTLPAHVGIKTMRSDRCAIEVWRTRKPKVQHPRFMPWKKDPFNGNHSSPNAASENACHLDLICHVNVCLVIGIHNRYPHEGITKIKLKEIPLILIPLATHRELPNNRFDWQHGLHHTR